MKSFDCNLCIHMNVCPAYMATQTSCKDYLPQGNVVPVTRCKDCRFYKEHEMFKRSRKWSGICREAMQLGRSIHEDEFCSRGERK